VRRQNNFEKGEKKSGYLKKKKPVFAAPALSRKMRDIM